MNDTTQHTMSLIARTLKQTAEEIEGYAGDRFKLSDTDYLGWQHFYQAIYLRTLARNIEKELNITESDNFS